MSRAQEVLRRRGGGAALFSLNTCRRALELRLEEAAVCRVLFLLE
eukprot:CAMPEP_0183360806 /NCGR_PEP_ID=MMETSP0164_2-20130417/56084_1 /TAXON_ID=221442 /ORGANISM="Coccolithus pelagicus ssp braarudi, Strain PLY182g" /LENGTH=44 /DNA_ID= /DNA_START= /DNA_END= /DNA_ORIENTATION=